MWHYRLALAQRCTIEPVRRSPQKLAGLITNQNRAISILPFRRQTSLNVSYPSSIVDFGIEDISSFLAFFGFAASVVAAYLKLNKLWSRRHSEEVTQSISVSAFALDLLIYACYGFNFYLLGIKQGLLASI